MEYLELNGICYVGDVEYRIMCFKRETSIVNNFWYNGKAINYNEAIDLIENNKIVTLNLVI